MASTLVCEVRRRLPFAHVFSAGTLDRDSMVGLMVELRDCLADLPTALIIQAPHLVISPMVVLTPLIELLAEAMRWPGVATMWCGGAPSAIEALRASDSRGVVQLCPTLDEAVLVAARMPVPARVSVHLAPDRNAPAKARDLVDSACTQFHVARVSKLAQLLVSELVTNAVIHAGTGMTVTVRATGSTLQMVVRDQDPRPMYRPVPGTGSPTAEHGRGLLVLDAMADRWGTLPTRDGKAVWAEVIMPAM